MSERQHCRRIPPPWWILPLVLGLSQATCGPGDSRGNAGAGDDGLCPTHADAPEQLPNTEPKHETLTYWLGRLNREHDLDEVLLSEADIDALNGSLRARAADLGLHAFEPLSASALAAQLRERLAWLRVRLKNDVLRGARNLPLPPALHRQFAAPSTPPDRVDRIRVTLAPVSVRCGPWLGSLHKHPPDHLPDRNRCSTVRPQEPLEVLSRWPGELLLVRTGYTLGWISDDAPLSPPLPASARQRWLTAPRFEPAQPLTLRAADGTVLRLTPGIRLPAGAPGTVLFATDHGVHPAPAEALRPSRRPLTRRALLETAFSYLGTPYGWGGEDGGLDCSRFIMELLGSFGIRLPRTSSYQALAGTFSIDLRNVRDDARRRWIIERAAQRGVVLLHLPGHIMLYLGTDDTGTPRVLHSLSEYAIPCAAYSDDPSADADVRVRVERVCVTGLELGRGSERRSLIERLHRVTVLGAPPGPTLQGIAALRPAAPIHKPAECDAEAPEATALLISPRQPDPSRPLRVIVSTSEHPGSAELAVFRGRQRQAVEIERLGGPPYAYVARLSRPPPGQWTAVFGEGGTPRACRRFRVRSAPPSIPESEGELAWPVRRQWDERAENLYATFVESLFRYPSDRTRTWSALTPLLHDQRRNLLYDHQIPGADDTLRLTPDCADLPYYLRAYFAWKLGLPFGFRECTRARDGWAARCKGLRGHHTYAYGDRPAHAFGYYAHQLKGRVHSSNLRTWPTAQETDYYPVALARAALRPGVVFADPYGHTLVITRWISQTTEHPGQLVAVDAQPDGTVGLRRFWRGSFLFTTDGARLGAGWKMSRPVHYDPEAERSFRALANEELAAYAIPYSARQRRLSPDAFYCRMSAFINPLPLNPEKRLVALVDAFHETVRRRVQAVQLGVSHRAEQSRDIRMPEGAEIFLTEGDWERYATPSRDLRLLVALDVVTDFPGRVANAPARYGLDGATRRRRIARLWSLIEQSLRQRSIRYRRSDGTTQGLSLYQIVGRQRALEMAYNPNDCIEVRWGAPVGSAERASCERRAPAAQRARMQQYRAWFRERRRPAR